MKLEGMIQAAIDFWHPNRYQLKKYLINDGKKHPFALICPGGGYSMVCSFVEGLPYARELNKRGYHAFVLYYHVKKKAKYPAVQLDVERAVKEINENAELWKVDTRCWSLWGSSAGGHLAASYCTEPHVELPAAIVLSYPVITMSDDTHKGSAHYLLGKNPSDELRDKLSVEKNINENYPATYVWWGSNDELVDPVNSKKLIEALQEKGITCRFHEFNGVGHGVGLGKNLSWFDEAIAFWEEQR